MKKKTLCPAILLLIPLLYGPPAAAASQLPRRVSPSPAAGRPAPMLPARDSASQAASLALAERLMVRKEYEQAERIYQQYLLGNGEDLEVRLKLGRMLSWMKKYQASLAQYELILKARPDDLQVRREYALVLFWQGDLVRSAAQLRAGLPETSSGARPLQQAPAGGGISDLEARLTLAEILSYRPATQQQALQELQLLIASVPGEVGFQARLAGIAANTGQARTAARLYEEALQMPGATAELRLAYAERLSWWGDCHAAERIYRAYLLEQPGSREAQLGLARLYSRSERYEEAEGIYLRLQMLNPAGREELPGLVELKMLEKDYQGALALIDARPAGSPDAGLFLKLRGAALAQAGRSTEARASYLLLLEDEAFQAEALLGAARSYIEERDPAAALPYLERSLALDPENVEAGFYRDLNRIEDGEYLREKLERLAGARQMERLGGLYASRGYSEQAIACYRAALARDPEYFQARLELAGVLATTRQYDRSIEMYRRIAAEFPGNCRIMTGLARVLGWSKQYRESIELYGELERQNPLDPVPRREKARTALWSGQADLGATLYRQMLTPPADRSLLASLGKLQAADSLSGLDDLMLALRRSVDQGSIYQGYETLALALRQGALKGEQAKRAAVEKALAEQRAGYRIQKGVALEWEAKSSAQSGRPLHALAAYDQLTMHQPGNEEALFDRGQTACSLDLGAEAKRSYQKLLEIDPAHWLAAEALSRELDNRRPALLLEQSYWEEKGRGELSRIRRQQSTLGVTVPLFDGYHLSLAGHRWLEAPTTGERSYAAYGHTLAFDGVINRYLSGALSWSRKEYDLKGLEARNSGSAGLSFNLNDYLRWDLGYRRSDELYNEFGILQGGIQADAYWTSVSGTPLPKLSLAAKGGYLRYNDDNRGEFATLSAGYALSDHPRVFTVGANGEYRNTRSRSENIYDRSGTRVLDITHPYWTPDHYLAQSLTLAWNHDLSTLFFCGSRRHVYDLKASFGTDNDHNLSARFEAGWLYEFHRQWSLSLNATLHRSQEWDAAGGRLDIKYRF